MSRTATPFIARRKKSLDSAAIGIGSVAQSSALDLLAVTTVMLLSFELFAITLAPTIVADDAGELVTAAYELGVPHPPGYPLWCILTHLWIAVLPFDSDVAWRANLFSAFCGALTCLVVYRICRQLGTSIMAAMAGALLLAVSREFWAQSVIAEVYTLNALIFTVCLWVLIKWDYQRSFKWLILFSLLLGFGMANHHTIGILGPMGLAWVAFRDRRVFFKGLLVLVCVMAFILPLTCYGYLMWSARQVPYMNWGDPSTWSTLISHAMRAQYKASYQPSERSWTMTGFQFLMLVRCYLDQYSPVVGLSLLLGIPWMACRRRDARWIGIVIISFGIALAFAWLLNTKPQRQEIVANEVFFIPAYIGVAIAASGCLDELARAIRSGRGFIRGIRLGTIMVIVSTFSPVVMALAYNWSSNNYANDWYAEDHAKNLFSTIEPNGVIFPSGDHNTFPLIYLHRVKQFRRDVIIADKYGYVESRDFPEVAKRIKGRSGVDSDVFPSRLPRDAVIAYLLTETQRPVYFTVKTAPPPGTEDIRGNIHQDQVGFLYRMARTEPTLSSDVVWHQYKYRNFRNGTFDTTDDYGAINIVTDYWFYQGLVQLAHHETPAGISSMRKAAEFGWGIKEVYNNIGSALAEYGIVSEAKHYYQEAIRLDDHYPSAQWNLARIASSNGRWLDAVKHFKKLLEASPDDFRVPGELGYLYLNRLNLTLEAVRHFQRSLGLNSHQPQIQKTLKELNRRGEIPDARPVLEADRSDVDFGQIVRMLDASTVVHVKNVSGKPIKIVDVAADCGCTDPSIDRHEIEAGGSAKLFIRFNEDRRLGKQTRKVTIRNDAGPPLVVMVHADVLAPVTSEPARIELSDALPNSVYQVSVTLRSHVKDTLPVCETVGDSNKMIANVQQLETDTDHVRLAVTLKTPARTGEYNESLRVRLGEERFGKIEIPVHVRVRDIVQIVPRSLFIKSLSGDKPVTKRVKISLPPGWRAKITQTHVSDDWIELVDPPSELGQNTTLTIRIDPRKTPERFSGSIGFVVDSPQVPPVVIPIYGYLKR